MKVTIEIEISEFEYQILAEQWNKYPGTKYKRFEIKTCLENMLRDSIDELTFKEED